MAGLRVTYRNFKKKLKLYLSVNWIDTWYFNLKMFPFSTAIKLPVFFYGSVRFQNLKGNFKIEAPIERGMIGFGQAYEKTTRHLGLAELSLEGTIACQGRAQFGKDYFIHVSKGAILELGNMAGMASLGKIICTNKITFNTYARVGSECQIIDTDFHQMIDTRTQEKLPISQPIVLGEYNYVGRWSSIMKGTKTPNYCTVASNTLCNNDYTSYGNNILIGGMPAKLLKEHISRDWEGEREMMERSLILNV